MLSARLYVHPRNATLNDDYYKNHSTNPRTFGSRDQNTNRSGERKRERERGKKYVWYVCTDRTVIFVLITILHLFQISKTSTTQRITFLVWLTFSFNWKDTAQRLKWNRRHFGALGKRSAYMIQKLTHTYFMNERLSFRKQCDSFLAWFLF